MLASIQVPKGETLLPLTKWKGCKELPAGGRSTEFCPTCGENKVEMLPEHWEVAVRNSFSKLTVAWDTYSRMPSLRTQVDFTLMFH